MLQQEVTRLKQLISKEAKNKQSNWTLESCSTTSAITATNYSGSSSSLRKFGSLSVTKSQATLSASSSQQPSSETPNKQPVQSCSSANSLDHHYILNG